MKKVLKHFTLLLTLVLMLPLFSMKTEAAAATSMTVLIAPGKSVSLGMSTSKNALKKATWKSSKTSVATVNSYGVVKAKKKGSATITAKINGKTKSIKVIVAPTLQKATLNKKSLTLYIGQSYTLKGSLSPIGAKAVTSWKSSKKSVATVSSTGVVKAIKAGKTTITFTANNKKATCTVTVKKKAVKKYTMTGTLTNSTDGSILSRASLKFRKGYNNKSGSVYASTSSNSRGEYSVKLAEGNYTLQASRSGYATSYMNISCRKPSSTHSNRTDVSMSSKMKSSTWRVVLTWGETPRDLDSHLTGPSSNGNRFHVYYSNKLAYNSSGVQIANLDVDDTTSYGPETVTVFKVGSSGTYRYTIHDYTNRYSSYSTGLAYSGAKVNVYKGSKQVATFNVPKKAGTTWHVFDIVNGKLKKKNIMGYESVPSSIQ